MALRSMKKVKMRSVSLSSAALTNEFTRWQENSNDYELAGLRNGCLISQA